MFDLQRWSYFSLVNWRETTYLYIYLSTEYKNIYALPGIIFCQLHIWYLKQVSYMHIHLRNKHNNLKM